MSEINEIKDFTVNPTIEHILDNKKTTKKQKRYLGAIRKLTT